MQSISLKRFALAFAAMSLVLVGVAAPVAADHPGAHSGSYGRHYLADTEEYPGVRCHYDSNQNLDRIKVIDPFVYALSDDPDSRTVSWRFVVQQKIGSGTWTGIGSSSTQFRQARTDRTAAFSPISVGIEAPNGAAIYRAVVKMAWYVGGKAINRVGTASHRADWYRYPLAAANPGFCPGSIL